MRISLTVLLVASMGLGACGIVRDSALNPSNWFGRSASVPVDTASDEPVNPLIPTQSGLFQKRRAANALYIGTPFDEIVDLTVERTPGGALVRATGRAARQGTYSVQLTPANEDAAPVNGVLTFRLEGIAPTNTAVGTPPTREVTAARNLTVQDLRGVRTIRVEGLRNARVVRR
ncbi:hypothetical protein [uncultured Sulfitobacter sp.]|uniref:hypothetical protein n=1 Tax=uncultured Sulfitobacter sp. TaxID=191468 RepID=UPI00261B12EB|nr:hypothetical protein [uncultured Sulfitobacter sp.]